MKTRATQTPEAGVHAVANTVGRQGGGHASASPFVDNRPAVTIQRKWQKLAENSPRQQNARQLQAMASPRLMSSQGRPASGRVLQRAPFDIKGEKKNTDDFDFQELRALILFCKRVLDPDTLSSLLQALETDQKTPPKASKLSPSDVSKAILLIAPFLDDVEIDRLLLDARIFNLSTRLNVDPATLRPKIERMLDREGVEYVQQYLKNLITALDHAKDTDDVIAALMGRKFLRQESVSSGGRPEAVENVAHGILKSDAGGSEAWSVSGSDGPAIGREMAKSKNPLLGAAASFMIGPPPGGGRYASRAAKFFKLNTRELEHHRALDSEAQILDFFLTQLLPDLVVNAHALSDDREFERVLPARKRVAVKGVVIIHTDRTPCLSCGTIIDIFRKDFPSVQVIITYRRQYGILSREMSFESAQIEGQHVNYRFLPSLSEAQDRMLNPEERDSDAEYREEAARAALEKKRKEEAERQRKLESQKVKKEAFSGKLLLAQQFITGKLPGLKQNERTAYDTYFAAPGKEFNMNNLVKAVAEAKNDAAKLQILKTSLKPFL